MCMKCGRSSDTTRHLLYWQFEWLKRFLLTWYHIVNRRAYRKWRNKYYKSREIPNLTTEQVCKILIANSNRPWDVLGYKNPFDAYPFGDN